MNLIYYYPLRVGAPANVGGSIFKYLLKRKKELSFEEIMLFVPKRDLKEVQKQFSDLEVITYKNLNSVSKNSVIHIPISPLFYPNSKFLLHLFAIFKREKLILNYHGDTRTEMYLRFKYQHSLNITDIPSFIAIPYLLKSADKLIVNSYLMSNLVKTRYRVKNDVVIPNGIDDFWFDDGDKTKIDLEGDPALFYHGRLSPEKGVDLLIKGFAKEIGSYSKAKLYIAADGQQQGYLKNMCMNLGIETNVIFLGHVSKNSIKSYLESAVAAIYPSIWDNFPLAFMEAFSSANCPVYFSKQAGICDFVMRNEYDLNAFEPTVENISEIIKDVIDGNYDTEVIRQQKDFAKQYTWDNVIGQYLKVYNDFTE